MSIKELESNIQKELEKLLTRTILPSSTLINLNKFFVNGQNQLILKVLKNLPNDAYYKATLKLKKDHQQTPRAIKLKQNLKKLQNQFIKLKVSQHIKQWNYYCLDILQDIKDQFQDLQREQTRVLEYRQCIDNILKQYFDDNMSPERFIQYIINHQNFLHLTSKEIKNILFVKQKIYPPSKKIIQQKMIDKECQKLKMNNSKNEIKKRVQNNNNFDKNEMKSQFSTQNIRFENNKSNKVFNNNKNVNNTDISINNTNNIKGAQSKVTYNQSIDQKKTQQNKFASTGEKQSQNIEDQIKANKIDIKNQLKNDINVNPNINVYVQNNIQKKSQDEKDEQDDSYHPKLRQQYSQQLLNQFGHQQDDQDESDSEQQDNSFGQNQYYNDND